MRHQNVCLLLLCKNSPPASSKHHTPLEERTAAPDSCLAHDRKGIFLRDRGTPARALLVRSSNINPMNKIGVEMKSGIIESNEKFEVWRRRPRSSSSPVASKKFWLQPSLSPIRQAFFLNFVKFPPNYQVTGVYNNGAKVDRSSVDDMEVCVRMGGQYAAFWVIDRICKYYVDRDYDKR